VHVLLGYTVAGLVIFRLLWGVIGTRYARFTSFPLLPRAAIDYLKSVLKRSPRHYFGHNPAGSWAIVALLVLIASIAVTGWGIAMDIGPGSLEDMHEALSNTALALVVMHVVAVIASSLLHRENLVRAMLTGYKAGRGLSAAGTRWFVAVVLIGAVAAFWAGVVPAPGIEPGQTLAQAAAKQSGPPSERGLERRRNRDDD